MARRGPPHPRCLGGLSASQSSPHFLGSFRHLGKQLLPHSCGKRVAEAAPRLQDLRDPHPPVWSSEEGRGEACQACPAVGAVGPPGASSRCPRPSAAQPPPAALLRRRRLSWPQGAELGLGWAAAVSAFQDAGGWTRGGRAVPTAPLPSGPGSWAPARGRGPGWGPRGACSGDGQSLPRLWGSRGDPLAGLSGEPTQRGARAGSGSTGAAVGGERAARVR